MAIDKKEKEMIYDLIYEVIDEFKHNNSRTRSMMAFTGSHLVSNFAIVDTGAAWEQAIVADGLIRIADSLNRVADAIEKKSNIDEEISAEVQMMKKGDTNYEN